MSCPPEIAAILLDIIDLGIMKIRAFGWANESQRCSEEADHIHNLPDLLKDYSSEKMAYYWEVERDCYKAHATLEDIQGFEPLWKQLAAALHASSVNGAN